MTSTVIEKMAREMDELEFKAVELVGAASVYAPLLKWKELENEIHSALQSAYLQGRKDGREEAAVCADKREAQELRSRDKAKEAGREGVSSRRQACAETARDIATAIRNLSDGG